jgi:DNA-binding XRE family transcriptional regulator
VEAQATQKKTAPEEGKRPRRLAPEPEADDVSLGAQFVRRRRELGISQEELAKLAGVDQASISRVEQNKPATTNLIFEMARALDARLTLEPAPAAAPARGRTGAR